MNKTMQRTISLTLNVRKTKAKKLTEFLKEIDFVKVQEDNDFNISSERFEAGSYTKGENPSQSAGIWKNHDHRLTANEIRQQAWQRKVRK